MISNEARELIRVQKFMRDDFLSVLDSPSAETELRSEVRRIIKLLFDALPEHESASLLSTLFAMHCGVDIQHIAYAQINRTHEYLMERDETYREAYEGLTRHQAEIENFS